MKVNSILHLTRHLLCAIVMVLMCCVNTEAATTEIVLMWKEAKLYMLNGNSNPQTYNVGSYPAAYPYAYHPVNHFGDFLETLTITEPAVHSTAEGASEKDGSALTTGKHLGAVIKFTAKANVSFTHVYCFGKIENDLHNNVYYRFQKTDDSWTDWLTIEEANDKQYYNGDLGKDAAYSLCKYKEGGQIKDRQSSGPNFKALEIRNGNGSATGDCGGFYLRNMAITVDYTGDKKTRWPIISDPKINNVTQTNNYLEYVPNASDLTLSITAKNDQNTTSGLTYQWYLCDFKGTSQQALPDKKSNTLTITSEQQVLYGCSYYNCIVTYNGLSVKGPVFCVNGHPEDKKILRYFLPESGQGSSSYSHMVKSSVYVDANLGNYADMQSNGSFSNNGYVQGMTDKIAIKNKKGDYIPFVFQSKWSKPVRISEIIMEVQPVSYSTEMFYAELDDGKGHKVVGQCIQPTAGVGNLLSFTYPENFILEASKQYEIRLYGWDPSHSDATFRLGRLVSVYAEIAEALPDPELHWMVAPENGKTGDKPTIFAKSNNSSKEVHYGPNGSFWEGAAAGLQTNSTIVSVNLNTGALSYDNPGIVKIGAGVQGDHINSNSGKQTVITRTVIIENSAATIQCSEPTVIVTGQNDNFNTRVTFCQNDAEGIAGWSGLTATAGVKDGEGNWTQLADNENISLVWQDAYKNELMSQSMTKAELIANGNSLQLTFKPQEVGTYRAVVMVYDPANKKTTTATVASVQYRLLTPPNRPTIEGPRAVQKTRKITLTATTNSAESYQWYRTTIGGTDFQPIAGATSSTYTWQTTNDTEIGTYYFFVEAKAANRRVNGGDPEELTECSTSERSVSHAVNVVKNNNENWYFLLNEQDAEDNFIGVSHDIRLTTTGKGADIPFLTKNQSGTQTPDVGGNIYTLNYTTASVTNPEVHFTLAGVSATVYFYGICTSGAGTLTYQKLGADGSTWTTVATKQIPTQWGNNATVSQDITEGGTYRVLINGTVQVAMMAAKVKTNALCSGNTPILNVGASSCSGTVLSVSDVDAANASKICWSLDNTILTNAESQPITGLSYTATESGWYRAVLVDGDCKSPSEEVEVAASKAPTTTGNMTDWGELAPGTYIKTAPIINAARFQWYRATKADCSDAVPVSDASGKSQTLTFVVPAYLPNGMDFYVYCIGSSACGSVRTNTIHGQVNNPSVACLDMSKADNQAFFQYPNSEVLVTYAENLTIANPLINLLSLNASYTSSDLSIAEVVNNGTEIQIKRVGNVKITATPISPTSGGSGRDICAGSEYVTSVILHIEATNGWFLPNIDRTGAGACENPYILHAQKRSQGATTEDYTDADFANLTWYKDGQVVKDIATGDVLHSKTCEVTSNGTYTLKELRTVEGNTVTLTSNSIIINDIPTQDPWIDRLCEKHYFRKGYNYADAPNGVGIVSGRRRLCRVHYQGSATGKQWKAVAKTHGEGGYTITSTDSWVIPDPSDPSLVLLDMSVLYSRDKIAGFMRLGAENYLEISIIPKSTCHNDVYDARYAETFIVQTVDMSMVHVAYVVPDITGTYNSSTQQHNVQANIGNPFLMEGYDYTDDALGTYLTTGVRQYDYCVTPVNAYTDFHDYNYDAFDLVLISPYLKSMVVAGSGVSTGTYIENLAQLVGRIPILNLESDRSADQQWAYVGLGHQIVKPTPIQKTIIAGCDVHPIFNGLTLGADKSLTLFNDGQPSNAAIYGFNHSKVGGVGKQRVALVAKGDGTMLTAIGEVQTLRLLEMPLSVASMAAGSPNDNALLLVNNMLQYLINMENGEYGDCSLQFDNHSADTNWHNEANWYPFRDELPGATSVVRIKSECRVKNDSTAFVGAAVIDTTASITIEPKGALVVENAIQEQTKSSSNTLTRPELLKLESDANGSAILVHNDITGSTYATVDFYSIASGAPTDCKWQWMTTPFRLVSKARDSYEGGWMYQWKNESQSWATKITNSSQLTAFTAYCITNTDPTTYEMTGPLAPTADKTISLYYKDDNNNLNLIGNSWTAPIRISQFQASDFSKVTPTIVMFNTGLDTTGKGTVSSVETRAAGTYVSIPIASAASLPAAMQVIPAMQAFQVKTTGLGAKLKLVYNRLCRFSSAANKNTQPTRAPKRAPYYGDTTPDNGITDVMRITVSNSQYADFVYLFLHPDCSSDYDWGYDGEKIYTDNTDAPSLYVLTENADWQMSAQSDWNGTLLGFYRGNTDSVYTFSFDYAGDHTYYLYDSSTDTYTRIQSGETYRFVSMVATNDDLEERFMLTDFNPNAEAPTDLDNVEKYQTIQVDVREDKAIARNLTTEPMLIQLMDAAGKTLWSVRTKQPMQDIPLPTISGVYLIDCQAGNAHSLTKVIR